MNAYPNLGQTTSSEPGVLDEVHHDRATNGTLRARAMWSAPKRRFRVEHVVNAAGRDTVLAFYAAHRTNVFQFTWAGDGLAYLVAFVRPPSDAPLGGVLWRVTVEMEEA